MAPSKKPSSATYVSATCAPATCASASHDIRAQHSARRSSLSDTRTVQSDGSISKLSAVKKCHSVNVKKHSAAISAAHMSTPAAADASDQTNRATCQSRHTVVVNSTKYPAKKISKEKRKTKILHLMSRK